MTTTRHHLKYVTGKVVGGPKHGQTLKLIKPTSNRPNDWTLDVRRDENGEPLFIDGYQVDAKRGELRFVNTVDLDALEHAI